MTQSFGEESTTDDVLEGVELKTKRVLVTGVSAGLGVETARALAARGAQVVGAARDLGKARRVTAEIPAQAAATGGSFELVHLDLASLASVRSCASALRATGERFDLIVANAGVMACPLSYTEDDFEMQFGTNHLGHFVLINRLVPLLRAGARVVNVSSSGHLYSDIDLEDPNFKRTPYSEVMAYARSKTANILFAVELDRRHKAHAIRATAVHPGVIQTELTRYMSAEARAGMGEHINAVRAAAGQPPLQWKSVKQGAATAVWAGIVAPAEEVGGRYCEDCQVAPPSEGAALSGVRSYALDPERAKALWAKSEQMVGEHFDLHR